MSSTLSAALIVKNEASHLKACFASLQPLVDEICVVDTGSTDGTPALAEELGAKLSHFPWCNDFSAARNASLAQCTCDWIFVVDADERLDAADIQAFRALLTEKGECCYRFVTRNYTTEKNLNDFVPCSPNDPNAQGFPGWFPSTKVRLFPNGIGAHFVGPVHELVNDSLTEAGIEIATSDIPIHHYPLLKSEESLHEKRLLYIKLGQDKIQAHPDDPKAHMELAVQYMELGAYPQAAAAWRNAVRLAPKNAECLQGLGTALFLLGRASEAETALRLAVQHNDKQTDAWRNLGVLYANAGNWEAALDAFQHLTSLQPQQSDAWRYLAIAQVQLGHPQQAAESCKHALTCPPVDPQTIQLFREIMQQLQRTPEASAFLQQHGL